MRGAAAAALSAFALLAACGEPAPPPPPPAPAADPTVTAVERFGQIGGRVTALALLPSPTPYLGRGLAALASGDMAILDLTDGIVQRTKAPRAEAIAVAPEFSLRGATLPLVVLAGGELTAPAPFLLVLSDKGPSLAPIPADPIAPDFTANGVCTARATPALIEIIVLGDEKAERWRLRDKGAETLASERLEALPALVGARRCAALGDGGLAALDTAGKIAGKGPGGALDIAAIDAAGRAFGLVAAPAAGRISALDPADGRTVVALRVAAGLNTADVGRPALVAASPANFGGSYADGVVLVAEGESVTVVALADVKSALLAALRPAAPAG